MFPGLYHIRKTGGRTAGVSGADSLRGPFSWWSLFNELEKGKHIFPFRSPCSHGRNILQDPSNRATEVCCLRDWVNSLVWVTKGESWSPLLCFLVHVLVWRHQFQEINGELHAWLIFLPGGLQVLQQKLEDFCSQRPVRASFLNINAETLKINSAKGECHGSWNVSTPRE